MNNENERKETKINTKEVIVPNNTAQAPTPQEVTEEILPADHLSEETTTAATEETTEVVETPEKVANTENTDTTEATAEDELDTTDLEADITEVASTQEKIPTEIPRSSEMERYYQNKEADHQEIEQLIATAERELADLKLRKALMEADFGQLLQYYQELILPNEPISPIAKKTLLEYFSYELLKPLHTVGLTQGSRYDVWQSKHFLIQYQLTETQNLALNFQMTPIDSRFTTAFMNLMTVKPGEMVVEVEDNQVLELVRQWHVEHVFSTNQLSLINYDLNQLLTHFRELGFTITPSLLDNAHPLQVRLDSEFPLEASVLDDIFIKTMENPEFDFETLPEDRYQVLLDQEQKLTISEMAEGVTSLFVDSDNRRRSLLDFFTSYPFLVPLMVR
ncbi:hypothetical protein P7G87_01035 [Enterococcus asini]|uniref:hypothetical protein n=1 Tax=Enterococcus asini TaxID=57732 RepID=UPI00288F3597|nr:hypothetical protein [Enterococcus asini]MDT2783271.1 hypothetical protein [Enterococcus asini]